MFDISMERMHQRFEMDVSSGAMKSMSGEDFFIDLR